MKRTLFITILCALMFSIQLQSLCAKDREFDEYEVKAAFLVNFFKFVEWPGRSSDGDGAYNLCIYGSDPFGRHAKIIEGIKVRGKPLEIKRTVSARSMKECNILFISSSERRRINTVLNAVKDMDLLTVGDTEGYAQHGVMVNFFIDAKKVKFEINLNAIKRVKINVSSQLLKLGKTVSSE